MPKIIKNKKNSNQKSNLIAVFIIYPNNFRTRFGIWLAFDNALVEA
jgi:hypothetical protein